MRNPLRTKPVIEQVTDDLIEQQQVASAEQMRQQYVDDIANGVQDRIDLALAELEPKGIVLDDPLADGALWTGMGLMAGGGAVSAVGKSEDDEMIKKAKELGIIT